MPLLTQLLLVIAFAVASAQIVKFIDFCFSDKNILDWYYLLILSLECRHPKLFKVLGGCIVCFGFWVNLGLFLVTAYCFNLPYIWGILFMGMAQTILMRYADV